MGQATTCWRHKPLAEVIERMGREAGALLATLPAVVALSQGNERSENGCTSRPIALAVGGMLALVSALGIGQIV